VNNFSSKTAMNVVEDKSWPLKAEVELIVIGRRREVRELNMRMLLRTYEEVGFLDRSLFE
jgi:hypothetical protein